MIECIYTWWVLNKHSIILKIYFNLKISGKNITFIVWCNFQNKYNVWMLILVWSFLRMNEDEILWWFCRLFMLQINDYISGNKQDKQMLCVYSSFKSTPEVLLAYLLYICYIMTCIWMILRTEKIATHILWLICRGRNFFHQINWANDFNVNFEEFFYNYRTNIEPWRV